MLLVIMLKIIVDGICAVLYNLVGNNVFDDGKFNANSRAQFYDHVRNNFEFQLAVSMKYSWSELYLQQTV